MCRDMIGVEGRRCFGYLPDVNDLETIPNLGGHLSSILFILSREKHCFHAGSISSNELLFDTSDPLDMARELELALFQSLACLISRDWIAIGRLRSWPW